MAYKSSVYIKAKAALDDRRKRAETDQMLRRSEVLMKCPEILNIEREMSSFGTELIKLVSHGVDPTEQIEQLAQKSKLAKQKKSELLLQNGFSGDYLDVKYHCPLCSDTGSHEGYYCSCYMELITQTARAAVCSPALLDASSFESFSLGMFSDKLDPQARISPRAHMEQVKNFCYEYAHKFTTNSPGIFMFGKTGLGKTHLSLAIADVVTRAKFDVCYTSVQNLMSRLEREHFGKDNGYSNREADTLSEVIDADLLILDDLGAEFSTTFTVAQLYNILNTRIIDNKPTIISTNLTLEEIENRYSQRVTSRIMTFRPIKFFGEDIRVKKAF